MPGVCGGDGATQRETDLPQAGSRPPAVAGEGCGVDAPLWNQAWRGGGCISTHLVGTTPCRVCSLELEAQLLPGLRNGARLGVRDGGLREEGTGGDFQRHPGGSYAAPPRPR